MQDTLFRSLHTKWDRLWRRALYLPANALFLLTVLQFLLGLLLFQLEQFCFPLLFLLLFSGCYLFFAWVLYLPKIKSRLHRLMKRKRFLLNVWKNPRTRAGILLSFGFLLNLGYAVFSLAMGLRSRSLWQGSIGIYYLLLCFSRYLLLREYRRLRQMPACVRCIREVRIYRLTGAMLLMLQAAQLSLLIQMLVQNRSYAYSGFLLFLLSVYTAYRLIAALIRNLRLRRAHSPLLLATRSINLAVALLSLLALQTAVLSRFSADAATARIANGITGGLVFFWNVTTGIRMLAVSRRTLSILCP